MIRYTEDQAGKDLVKIGHLSNNLPDTVTVVKHPQGYVEIVSDRDIYSLEGQVLGRIYTDTWQGLMIDEKIKMVHRQVGELLNRQNVYESYALNGNVIDLAGHLRQLTVRKWEVLQSYIKMDWQRIQEVAAQEGFTVTKNKNSELGQLGLTNDTYYFRRSR